MAQAYHIGQRLSFDSHLCTVRYIGPVTGTQKEWLGVEWDDPSRGKHDGRSTSKTAASFVRLSRIADSAQSFVEAVHQKYASEITERRDALFAESQIEISGKIVEEVGFDKIRQQLAQLHELKIVIVDGLRIATAQKDERKIGEICPKIVELDLSRNLFENCEEIINICCELKNLRVLRLNGNRLQIFSPDLLLLHYRDAFKAVRDLSLDEMLLTWEEACCLVACFPTITSLSVNSNEMWSLYEPKTLTQSSRLNSMSEWGLKSLTLDYNKFSRLVDLQPLVALPFLESLHLKGNHIEAVSDENGVKPVFGKHLQYVDLSYNNVSNWAFVDELPDIFPGLTALRFSHNPIYENPTGEGNTAMVIEEGYMLTLARIANLKILNFSNITTADRMNVEMFYMSRIGKAMASVPESEEHIITSQHRRFDELCKLYGAPTFVRVGSTVNPDFLEARLIKFNFHMPSGTRDGQDSTITVTQEIPKGVDVYQVKGIVGRLFGLRPLSLRLIWETGEWDPVAGYEDLEEDSDEEDERGSDYLHGEALEQGETNDTGREAGRWMRREVELEDGTRQIGFWVDGTEATVRIELLLC